MIRIEQNRIYELSNALEQIRLNGIVSAENIITAIEVEQLIGNWQEIGKTESFNYFKNLPELVKFRKKRKWTLDDEKYDYAKLFRKDIYLYYCLKGINEYKQMAARYHLKGILEGGEEEMWKTCQKLRKLFFELYKNMIMYIEFIPMDFIQIINNVLVSIKSDEIYSPLQLRIEENMFMFGLDVELKQMIDDKNQLNSGFLIN